MDTAHQTLPPLPVPFDGSPEELETAARQVGELLEHPGYAALLKAIEGERAMIDNKVSTTPPIDNVAFYADAAGERRGLAKVDRIAKGFHENAKRAALVSSAQDGGS